MGIFVNRAASSLRYCFSRLVHPSKVSSGRFSTSHTSFLCSNLARKLLYQTPFKNNFTIRNAQSITGKTSFFSQLVARIAAVITSFCYFSKTAQAASIRAASSEDLKAIAQKQGVMWECIGRTPDASGGYIYEYKLRKEYDYITLEKRGYDRTLDKNFEDELDRVEEAAFQKELEMFPAIEYSADDMDEVEVPKTLQDLGYMKKVDRRGMYISLPDQEALEARYEKMRKANPALKPLKIFSGQGIADDLTYIKAFLEYDVPLSEFLHDHMFHVMPTMNLMLSSPEYSAEKERLRRMVSTFYHPIVMAEKVIDEKHLDDLKAHLPKVKTAFGSVVDLFWTFRTIEMFKKVDSDFIDTTFFDYLNEDDYLNKEKYRLFHQEEYQGLRDPYQAFWKRRFGEELDPVALKAQWKQITTLGKKP